LETYKHFLVVDAKSYGGILAVVSQSSWVGEENVIEISPTAAGGILILQSDEALQLERLKMQLDGEIATSALVKSIRAEVVSAYLGQSQERSENSLVVQEFTSLADGFVAAQRAVEAGARIIDFRCLRSAVHRTILILDSQGRLAEDRGFCSTIANPSAVIKSFFNL
jgi:hypothetical protein